jgi:ADP-ribose pyrophosphatase YjhB (NUDIX family)
VNLGSFIDRHEIEPDSEFQARLFNSIEAFRQAGKTACWLKVPLELGQLIPAAGKHGFQFHHAEGSEATLVLWLKNDVESRIPTFATHQVGVGGLVIRNKGQSEPEILVVREAGNQYVDFKLPGGLADLGEDFGAAAVREVFEETGIQTSFEGLLTMRHQHGVAFGRSDIYCIAKLQTLEDSSEATAITRCEYELEKVWWMPLSEARAKNSHPMMAVALDAAENSGGLLSLAEEEHPSVVPGRAPYKLYFARGGVFSSHSHPA